MLPIKKIYIDSRHKTLDSVSDSNFKYELPYSIHLPNNAFFFTSLTYAYLIAGGVLKQMSMTRYIII